MELTPDLVKRKLFRYWSNTGVRLPTESLGFSAFLPDSRREITSLRKIHSNLIQQRVSAAQTFKSHVKTSKPLIGLK